MEFICKKQGLNVTDHFLQLKLPNSNSIKIPDKTVQLYAEVSCTTASCEILFCLLPRSLTPVQDQSLDCCCETCVGYLLSLGCPRPAWQPIFCLLNYFSIITTNLFNPYFIYI